MLKKISLYVLAALFILAGFNHFRSPLPYMEIIPPNFPNPALLNLLAGGAEILLGILLLIPTTRKFSAIGILLLLVAFIPVHIFMIQKGGCTGKYFCIPNWLAWVRLFPLQFILIYWAWWVRKI